MIILLTGKPGIGKTTVLKAVIAKRKTPMHWVVTDEIRDEQGGRVGFRASDSAGRSSVISHKTEVVSDIVIGQNHVDLHAVDTMFASALTSSAHAKLVMIDEIGPIQMLSVHFASAINELFHDGRANNLVATIHYKDEQLAPYRTTADAWLFEVTETNKSLLPEVLTLCLDNLDEIANMSQAQKNYTLALIKDYLAEAKLLQIKKLLSNAIGYVNAELVEAVGDQSWNVHGKHGDYQVSGDKTNLSCTCDLFKGLGSYADAAGECSHVQAVKLNAVKL